MNEKETVLLQWIGGSKLYGLDTPDSDTDQRSIVVKDSVLHNIGVRGKPSSKHIDNETEDIIKRDVIHFVKLLTKGNPEVVEVLFIPENRFLKKHSLMDWFLCQPNAFFDTDAYYNALSGYMKHEYKVAFGLARQGKMGDKRKKLVKKYGFSPKNLVQALRLCKHGVDFFNSGTMDVCMEQTKSSIEFKDMLREIKIKPEKFNDEYLKELFFGLERHLSTAYKASLHGHTVNLKRLETTMRTVMLAFGGFGILNGVFGLD